MSKLAMLEIDDLPDLADQLDDTHSGLSLECATQYGNWAISLVVEQGDRLQAASMTRCGSERYAFERTESGDWAAKDTPTRFPGVHFYNLVHIAAMEDLEWTVAPVAIS